MTETVEVERGALRQALVYLDRAEEHINAVEDYKGVTYLRDAYSVLAEYAEEDVDDD